MDNAVPMRARRFRSSQENAVLPVRARMGTHEEAVVPNRKVVQEASCVFLAVLAR